MNHKLFEHAAHEVTGTDPVTTTDPLLALLDALEHLWTDAFGFFQDFLLQFVAAFFF